MLKIVYTDDCITPIEDYGTKGYAEGIVKEYRKRNKDLEIKTCNESVVYAFEIEAMLENVPENEIEFWYKDEKLDFNLINGIQVSKKYGAIGKIDEVTTRIMKKIVRCEKC